MTGTALVKAEKSLTHYNNARRELAEAKRIDEVKQIRDYAMAAQVYARQAQDREMETNAIEIRLRAERKTGEILIAMKDRGERDLGKGVPKGAKRLGGKGVGHTGSRTVVPNGSKLPTLTDLGITNNQSSEWQKLAKTPDKKFEKLVAEAKQPRTRKPPKKVKGLVEVDWPDGDAPKPEFDKQVFLFNARNATELGESVLADIGDAEFADYSALEAATEEVISMWQSILTRLLKHKEKSNG